MNRQQIVRKKKKKKIIIKRLLFFTLLLLLIIGGYSGFLLYKTFEAANESYSELDRGKKSELRDVEIEAGKDPISILIMGIEDYSSGGKNGRSDSLLVATLNPESKTMKLLSIPRDTKVYIESEGKKDKINHAYAYGGKESTIETVESMLDIPIDYYATVNFSAFKDIVDEVGGITVEVPFDFSEMSDEDKKQFHFKEGKMTLEGEEALAYARMRKHDPRGDFGRNERQQQVLTAIIDKIMSPNNLLKLDDIAGHIGDNVETNMQISEALGLQRRYSNFTSKNISQLSIKGEDDYQGGVYYFVPDEESQEELIKELKVHLGIEKENDTSNTTTSDEKNS